MLAKSIRCRLIQRDVSVERELTCGGQSVLVVWHRCRVYVAIASGPRDFENTRVFTTQIEGVSA